MSNIDFSELARGLVQGADDVDRREQAILEYREFYETKIEPDRLHTSTYKIGKFLVVLAKEYNIFDNSALVVAINEIAKYSEDSFGRPLLAWFRESIPEVVKLKKDHPYASSAVEHHRLQYISKLTELRERIYAHGLHPDILKRDPAKYARYNVVLEYRPEGSTKNKKECKTLMSEPELEKQVLFPQRSQKPLQLNGRHFPANEIKRFTITQTLLLDAEVRLWKKKRGCTSVLSFCKSFPNVTDEMIHNPHLEDAPVAELNAAPYVEQKRIDAFKTYSGTAWDLQKLILLCNELNGNFQNGNYFSVAFLLRALMDHVPPILGCKNFEEVANNYPGDKSFKKAMEQLNKGLKHIADLHIHKQVAPKLHLPTMTQVDFRPALDLLLGELNAKL